MSVTSRQTERCRQALGLANREAVSLGSNALRTEHLLVGLLCEEDQREGSSGLLASAGVDREAVRQTLVENNDPGQRTTPGDGEQYRCLDAEARSAIDHASDVSDERLDYTIGVRHLLLGLLEEPDCAAARTLARLDVDLGALRSRAMAGIADDTSQRDSAGLDPVLQQQKIILAALGRISTRLDAIEARLDDDGGKA